MQHLSKQLSIFVLLLSIMVSFSSNTYAQQPIDSQVALEQALNKHKGEVIYLDFWASWCGPCRKSFPWMNNITTKYKSQGLVVLCVNVDNDRSFATEFLEETPASFIVFYDPKGEIAKQYKLKGMPSSYLLNRKGELVAAHTGFSLSKINSYEQEIEKQLNIDH